MLPPSPSPSPTCTRGARVRRLHWTKLASPTATASPTLFSSSSDTLISPISAVGGGGGGEEGGAGVSE